MTSNLHRDQYLEKKRAANSHAVLYHYTKFETLLTIIKGRSFRLSNLSQINDPIEYERLGTDPYIKDKVYVACFNHFKKDTIPMWKMYASGPDGIRIAFRKKDLLFFEDESQYYVTIDTKSMQLNLHNEWAIKDISKLDVIYDDNQERYSYDIFPYGDDDLAVKKPDAAGYIKTKDWEFEKETRIRVGLKNRRLGAKLIKTEIVYLPPSFTHIYCQVPLDTLLNMSIMFGPLSCNTQRKEMTAEIHAALSNYSDDKISNSKIRLQ